MKPLFTIYIALITCMACAQKKNTSFTSPSHYNLNEPQQMVFPSELEEVSGITFIDGDPNRLLAQQDEQGHVYYLRAGDKSAKHVKFAGKGDYEDIAISGSHVILLRSDGSFFTFPLQEQYDTEITAVVSEKILPKGEYESLAVSSTNNNVYVLCKQCNVDKKTTQTTGYILKLKADGQVIKEGSYSIDNEEISKYVKLKGKAFRPSALTRNQKTNEWYIVSSINKLLVIVGDDWKVKEAHSLNPKLFNQPEGIAFDRDNNLYISNEAGDTGEATLLKFDYKEKGV
ncbi:SdiA-regulated domain-containing protein [Olivibacter sp. CPCC 100613]|uniref:SdiA-regulated domain-containing protein n=1 Tax=Olivibacter sp. CPCC 100613 TaxID=3079931 RepID=UPI002FFC2BA9